MLKQHLILLNYELDKPLPKRKNKKVIELMEDELGKKIYERVSSIERKTYIYLIDNKDKDKKQKAQKTV